MPRLVKTQKRIPHKRRVRKVGVITLDGSKRVIYYNTPSTYEKRIRKEGIIYYNPRVPPGRRIPKNYKPLYELPKEPKPKPKVIKKYKPPPYVPWYERNLTFDEIVREYDYQTRPIFIRVAEELGYNPLAREMVPYYERELPDWPHIKAKLNFPWMHL